MTYYVYILQSRKNRQFYIGSTADVGRRLKDHNRGKVRSTRLYRPYDLVLSEQHESRQEAYRRERQIKRYKGGEAFRRLLNNRSGVV
jgi:putative endonuclease